MQSFKSWLAEYEVMGMSQRPPEQQDPNLARVANAAQAAVRQAVTQKKDPLQAAQKIVAQNVNNIPLKDLSKIMPQSPDKDPNKVGIQ